MAACTWACFCGDHKIEASHDEQSHFSDHTTVASDRNCDFKWQHTHEPLPVATILPPAAFTISVCLAQVEDMALKELFDCEMLIAEVEKRQELL